MRQCESPFDESQRGAVDGRILALIGGAVVLLVLVVALLFMRGGPEPPVPPGPPPEPPATAEERGDSAREVITELRATTPVDYARAHVHAREFKAEGRLADAQLLYFFAARGKYAPAALDLGEMYDPTRYSAETSLMDEPDAFQAYKWYTEARDAGDPVAVARLAELRAWAERAAGAGDLQAEQLLLQWQ